MVMDGLPIQRPQVPAPHFMMTNPYSMAPVATMPAPHYPTQSSYAFDTTYTPPSPASVPPFRQFPDERPTVRIPTENERTTVLTPYQKDPRQAYMEEHSPSPSVKSEIPVSAHSSFHSSPVSQSKTITANAAQDKSQEISFHTQVDTLMKAIQGSKDEDDDERMDDLGASNYPSPPHHELAKMEDLSRETSPTESDIRSDMPERPKPYRCTIKNCNKRFHQRTHLDIHKRAHTGEKPYMCRMPKCGERFSQLGNLKTHERRHTGERPYLCEVCGKAFAQRGNVKAHKETHNNVKRFQCKLDDCQKRFTQLGNMKSHMNKFHASTLQTLTAKFALVKGDDAVNQDDRELFEYFAFLYKNSNKGIKGRGKHRKVGPIDPTPATGMGVSSQFAAQHTSPPPPSSLPQQQQSSQPHPQTQAMHPIAHHGLPQPIPHNTNVPQYNIPRTLPGHSIMVGRDPRHGYDMYDQDNLGSTASGAYEADHHSHHHHAHHAQHPHHGRDMQFHHNRLY